MTTLQKDYQRFRRNARVRLAVRALLVGLAVGYARVKGHHIDRELLDSALVAGGWSALEAFTPLNGIVGIFKKDLAAKG